MAMQLAEKAAEYDPVRVDPKHHKIESENAQVRVLRIRYGPFEKSVMHAHPPLLAVFLTNGHIRFTYPDGRREEVTVKKGQVLDFPATTHLPENLSSRSFEMVGVELKG